MSLAFELKEALSNDVGVIETEINSFKRTERNAVFEIGRRLKHVKDNDLIHGQFTKWVEGLGYNKRTAQRYMKVYEKFGNMEAAFNLPVSKLFEMLTLPDEVETSSFILDKHEIPDKGETKTVVEMTRDELRSVIKDMRKPEVVAIEPKATPASHELSGMEALYQAMATEEGDPPIRKDQPMSSPENIVIHSRMKAQEASIAITGTFETVRKTEGRVKEAYLERVLSLAESCLITLGQYAEVEGDDELIVVCMELLKKYNKPNEREEKLEHYFEESIIEDSREKIEMIKELRSEQRDDFFDSVDDGDWTKWHTKHALIKKGLTQEEVDDIFQIREDIKKVNIFYRELLGHGKSGSKAPREIVLAGYDLGRILIDFDNYRIHEMPGIEDTEQIKSKFTEFEDALHRAKAKIRVTF